MENGLINFHDILACHCPTKINELEGSGAAGGIPLAGVGFFNATIKNGINTLLEVTEFDEKLKNTDLVITGEGKLDEQTLQGKVVYGVANASHSRSIKVKAVCGVNELTKVQQDQLHLAKIVSIKTEDLSNEYCMVNAFDLLKKRIQELF